MGMRLRSHPGFGVGFKYSEERRFGPWRYIESELVAATDAVHAEWDGDFVMISGHDLCLDVAFWKMEEGNSQLRGRHQPRQGADQAGRWWTRLCPERRCDHLAQECSTALPRPSQ